jgi:hypothetical protein
LSGYAEFNHPNIFFFNGSFMAVFDRAISTAHELLTNNKNTRFIANNLFLK